MRRVPVENLLSALPLLACPIGMGLMMWFMSRMNRGQEAEPAAAATEPALPAGDAVSADRLAGLRAQLEEVRAQQAAIAFQIERLSAESEPAKPTDSPSPGGPSRPRKHADELEV
jgi:hypothetical protein